MFGLQLHAALQGDLDGEIDRAERRIAASLQYAVFEAGAELQSKWRQDIASSGLRSSDRLQKTIRQRRYRNSGMDPATVVYSNFPIIQQAFERGVTVRSREGLFLAVPNPDVWPAGRVRRPQNAGGQRTNTVAIGEARFGPLRFVFRPGKPSLLVATVRASSARPNSFRRASPTALRTGNGLTTIVVFFLVPQARLPRMLRGDVIRARFSRDADRLVDRRFVERMNASEGGQALLAPPSDD